MNKFFIAAFTLVTIFSCEFASAQKQQYKVAIVGFYNLENLFDTVNNPRINDEEFLPNSPRQYNTRIYYDKLDRL